MEDKRKFWNDRRRVEAEHTLAALESCLDRLERVRSSLGPEPSEDQRDLLRLWAGAALDDLLGVASLVVDYPRREDWGYEFAMLGYAGPVPEALARELEELLRKHRPSLYSTKVLAFEEALEVADSGAEKMRECLRLMRARAASKEGRQ